MNGELQIPQWTWWIVLYFWLGGVAGGAYFLSAVVELVGSPEDRPVARMGYYIAFPLVLICALLLTIDLGIPARFWHMVLYSRTLLPWPVWNSPMSVGAFALLFFGLFSFLSFIDALIETGRIPWAPLREKYSGIPRTIYAILGGLFGFFLTAYTGELLSTSQLPVWTSTPLLGALFAASGAAAGMGAVALGLVLTKIRTDAPLQKIRRADIVAIVFELILLILMLIWLGSNAKFLLSGWGGVLIGGTILLGILIPLVLYFWPGRQATRHAWTIIVISVLTLLGSLMMRTAIVMGGQALL